MLEDCAIVCFAPNPWHDIWRNRQHIMIRLARRNRILFVEPGLTMLGDWRRGRLGWRDLRRPSVQHLQDGLYLYRFPAWLPGSRRKAVDEAMRAARAWHLRRAARRLGMMRPILWLYRPDQRPWIGEFSERLVLYHVTDEYQAFGFLTEAQRRAIIADEERLLAEADLTVVTSPRLWETRKARARRIALVPNGVDYAAFAAARREPAQEPDDLRAVPRPRLAYVGHVSLRLDLPLLAEVARARPNWSLVLLGSVWDLGCEAEMAHLRALPNVHFLAPREGPAVPSYLVACDVGLMPYRVNRETESISPLKLYEYLAAGLPVVSADVPAAREIAPLLYIASDGEGWVRAVEAALAERDPARREARQAQAAANDWDRRVEELSAHITAALAAKDRL